MIYRFRVILDAEEDVFRDIEMLASATLEDFHNAITQAFGFEGGEMASFYLSDNEWNQGEEFSLFDMSDGLDPVRIMEETALDSVLDEDQKRMIYLYDFLSMWTFYVELAEIAEKQEGILYPHLVFAHGQLPDSPPAKQFEASDELGEFGDADLDVDDYESLDFDENWN